MDNREKQIEEMAKIIRCNIYYTPEVIAKMLYDNNYRTMDEVTIRIDLGDKTPEEIKQIAGMFNGEIKKQVAKEILGDLLKHCDLEIEDSFEKSISGSEHYGGVNYAYHQMKSIIKSYIEKYGVEVNV